ncbi:winged helix-turn-helix DNA-binding domain, Heat shock transcription factor family [Artemisia annua]|uniref:Winged helix-turn-helix DNA-binding domain, Heat shock transcription factor family n=1 Tax=Artemisia annua TaxID=35608 RepID=A0A2U1P5I3_ARTAN|nr:winged helix-turn-helix DNA-binding domain, Heat shock transcription factor family [Artemisia annua]
MEGSDVEETIVVSDVSEDFSSGDEGGDGEGLLAEPIRGVRNGALPPFVNKLYNMVCNKETDSIISWVLNLNVSNGAKIFAIWNIDEFINNVLPLMSKSKNFDSFITQLSNYGFKKMFWDYREYAHEWFQEGKPHLLKNIKRRRKQAISESEKLQREIKKLESASTEQDNELNVFKAYVDNIISNQKRILETMARAMKSTIDHHNQVCKMHGIKNNNDATQNLTLVGEQSHKTSALGESSFAPSCEIQAKYISTKNARKNN